MTDSSRPTLTTARTPDIRWQGRVQFLVPANAEIAETDSPCIIVPIGSALELHVTNAQAVVGLLERPQDQLVQGLLTIRRHRDLPRKMISLTLSLDNGMPPALEFRHGDDDEHRRSFWSKRIPGTFIYIVPVPQPTEERIAA